MKYKWSFRGNVKVTLKVKGYGKLKFAMSDSQGETEADLKDVMEISEDFIKKCFPRCDAMFKRMIDKFGKGK